MSVLVFVEHDNENLKPATLHAVSAAQQIDPDVHLLVIGNNCQGVAKAACGIAGVSQVFVSDNESYAHQLAETVAPLIAELADGYTHVVAAATTTGKNVMPRAAALKDSQPLSDVMAIVSDSQFQRPIYAGNVIATVESSDAIKFLTVRTTAFDVASGEGGSAELVALEKTIAQTQSSFVGQELAKSDRPELTSARVVVSGGRGVQSSENFELLYKLADKLDAAVGASRAAVDAGFVPNDMQVGQTGKVVAPELYIAVGISGAIQHLAGMKDSKVIVAINKDEEAPIFQVADYGLVADLFDAIPALTELL